MRYVDGFVIPLPKKNVQAYRKLAKKAAKIWLKYGALEFRECVGDDLKVKMGVPFIRTAKLKPSETVFFSWIVYKSRAHRNQVNAKVMKDPFMCKMDSKKLPFNVKRMSYGGFKMLVDL